MTHTSTEQPEALRLAEHLENFRSFPDDLASARELRRQHALIAELESKLAAAPQAVQAAVPEAIEQMAVDRYKVVPSHKSMFHRWAVVAGNGTQQLYIGREGECQNMARKFMGAFLDGSFVAMQNAATAHPAEEAYMPFGDMGLAIQCALAAAPQPPEAEDLGKKLQDAQRRSDFFKRRCDLLQIVQRCMRDPERTLVCDVLANGHLLHDVDSEAGKARYLAPEAAPVELPEPAAFALEWTFNGEERGMRLYDDERHCRFDAESDGGVCHPLYTEQQVRELLSAQHGIK